MNVSEFFFFLSEESAVLYSRYLRHLRKQGKRPGVISNFIAAFGRKSGELYWQFKR